VTKVALEEASAIDPPPALLYVFHRQWISEKRYDRSDLPRAPRFWWEKTLFALVILLPSTIYPFATAFNSSITPFGTSLVVAGTLIVLLLLSIFWDIGPTFVEKAEARFQNRYAADIYSIPVTFDAKPTLVPGFSRLTAIRADKSQAIGAWALRFNHGCQVA